MDIEEYKNWLKYNNIRINCLAKKIGYNYRHLTLVLNGKKPLTRPIEKVLELYRELVSISVISGQ